MQVLGSRRFSQGMFQNMPFFQCEGLLDFCLMGTCYIGFSEASGSFLFSWRSRTWDLDLLRLFAIDGEKLSPVVSSSFVVGK